VEADGSRNKSVVEAKSALMRDTNVDDRTRGVEDDMWADPEVLEDDEMKQSITKQQAPSKGFLCFGRKDPKVEARTP